MRYRALDANGDMTFGHGSANFTVNTPATVAQAISTRLKLDEGEWFLDVTEGLPLNQILGFTRRTRDIAIRTRILQTQGVTGIVSYGSQLDSRTRAFTVEATVNTIYGSSPASISVNL